MSSHTKVKLGGKSYEVPKLNVGQLREVTRLFTGDKAELSFDVLEIAMRRVPDFGKLDDCEAGFDEIAKASADILKAAGLKAEGDLQNPPKAPGPTG